MGYFTDEPIETSERVIRINLLGVMYTCYAFLPLLVKEKDACLLNISSVAGFSPQSKMGSYCASKHGVRGLSECLQLQMQEDRQVRLSCLVLLKAKRAAYNMLKRTTTTTTTTATPCGHLQNGWVIGVTARL